jgi:hypothetical protein
MKRPPSFSLRLPRWHEWLIYAVTGLLVVTGVGWLLLDRFGKVNGEFGPEPSPTLPWLLLIHGAAAYGFAIAAAMLIPVHMRLGWNAGRNRRSGLLLVAISLFLILTGLALYYSTAEDFRSTSSLAHWLVGLAMPMLVLIHLIRGKKSRPGPTGTKSRTR